MSGGFFDYQQYRFGEIAKGIDTLINTNKQANEYGYSREYSPEVLAQFELGKRLAVLAGIYAQRVDWLVSGDDGEDCFQTRLREELQEVGTDPEHIQQMLELVNVRNFL